MHGMELTERNIHVWWVRTPASDGHVADLACSLSPHELARAAHFRTEELRTRFVLARGALRILLGRYLHISPQKVRFQYGPTGKPTAQENDGIYFNLSHSGSFVGLAFLRGCQVGLDVQEIRPVEEMSNIAQRFFCPEEAAELATLPENERTAAFFLCWTRKEAYVKATGDGLSAPLDEFRVALRPGEPARVLHIEQETAKAELWSLHNIPPAPDYAGALAYADRRRDLVVRTAASADELLCT